jgi:hypothetical protein
MKTIIILLSLLFLATGFCDEPAGRPDPLALALASFNWSWVNYDSGAKDVEDIQFYRDGVAENARYFTARWEATGSHTVVLRNTNRGTPSYGKAAYLVFDAGFTRFVGIDFNGRTNVEGSRCAALDPNRPVPAETDQKAK